MYECLIQICLKGLSNMMDLSYHGSNQFDQPMFWVIFVLCGLCSIAVMVWMRAGYARFEAVQMLPIQMATLTTCTVIGGLMFYGEYTRMSWTRLCMTAVGVGFIIGGIYVMNRFRNDGTSLLRSTRNKSNLHRGLTSNLLGEKRTSIADWDQTASPQWNGPGSLNGGL